MAYVTLAEVRSYGGYDAMDTSQDAELSALIPRAQAVIEQYTGNVFEVSSTSTRQFDAIANVDGYRLLFDGWLANTSSLVVTNGDGQTVASSQYVTLPRNDIPIYGLQLKSDATVVWEYTDAPENAISVVGNWGYSVTPPEDVKLACLRLVLYWIKLEGKAAERTIPSDVIRTLKPYKQTVMWV